jgi:Flp pilus assembly protein TadG
MVLHTYSKPISFYGALDEFFGLLRMSQPSALTETVKIKAVKANRPLGLVRRFGRERKGSTAIEFALLAMPFFAIMFAILETSLSFATQQLLANATDRISRDVRTGNLKVADLSGTKLKDRVCGYIALMAPDNCPGLSVDIKNYKEFADVPTAVPWGGAGTINQTGFAVTPGGPGTINHLRVFYLFPVFTDFVRAYSGSGGKTLLLATATWRNEPFSL